MLLQSIQFFHPWKYFLLFVAASVDSSATCRAEFSKCLHKVSLNKGMLKCSSTQTFFSSAAVYTDQLVHTNIFFPFPYPIQTNSSTQTFSSLMRGPRRPACPHGRFFVSVAVYTDLLDYTDVIFLLS